HGGPARFAPSAKAWPRSRHGDGAERSGSTTLHPQSPTPSPDAPTRVPSADRATFFSGVVRIGARDPVFRPLPLGMKPLEGPADAFITQQALRDALLIAHLRRQAQRPHPGGLAIEAWRLMQEMLEAVTGRGVQNRLDGLWPIRLLRQALHAP